MEYYNHGHRSQGKTPKQMYDAAANTSCSVEKCIAASPPHPGTMQMAAEYGEFWLNFLRKMLETVLVCN